MRRNSEALRCLARGQPFNKNKIDRGLAKLWCVLTHPDNETLSFWRDQTRRELVSTKSGEVQMAGRAFAAHVACCLARWDLTPEVVVGEDASSGT